METKWLELERGGGERGNYNAEKMGEAETERSGSNRWGIRGNLIGKRNPGYKGSRKAKREMIGRIKADGERYSQPRREQWGAGGKHMDNGIGISEQCRISDAHVEPMKELPIIKNAFSNMHRQVLIPVLFCLN